MPSRAPVSLRNSTRESIISIMRTKVDVDTELFKEAQRAAGKGSKARIVDMALRAFVEQSARKRLAALEGSIPKVKSPRRRRLRRGAA
jgi:Arc/MetJ family transcription regulator